jgi:hypothetical protein
VAARRKVICPAAVACLQAEVCLLAEVAREWGDQAVLEADHLVTCYRK